MVTKLRTSILVPVHCNFVMKTVNNRIEVGVFFQWGKTFENDFQRFVALMHFWAKMNMASGSSGVMMGPFRMS